MKNTEELQNAADRQWLTVYVCGAALGVWLIAFVLVLRFATDPDLGIVTTALLSVSFALLASFAILFVGEALKAQAASRALTAAREQASPTTTG